MDTNAPEEMEMRLAYLDDAVNQLSDTIYAQSRELEHLAQRCRQLESRIEALSEGDEADEAHAMPPHY